MVAGRGWHVGFTGLLHLHEQIHVQKNPTKLWEVNK